MMGYEPSPLGVVVGSPMLATCIGGGFLGVGALGTRAVAEGAMRAGMQSNAGRKRRAVRMDILLRLRDE